VAEAEYTTTTRVPIDAVWDFVQDMDNWGRFVTGYQRHEKQSDVDSTWTLKGDVGVLTRTLTFQVKILEWNGPSRVSFTLDGVNEPMHGEGTFTMTAVVGDGELGEVAARLRLATRDQPDEVAARLRLATRDQPDDVAARLRLATRDQPDEVAARLRLATRDDEVASAAVVAPRRGVLFRLLEAFWRWVLRVAGGGAPARAATATQAAAPGDTMTRLSFKLRLQPGGPMAPMVDAMIRPLLLPAAEDLANRILAQLEGVEATQS
jgi:carbon monoxide dehydrogenase subunit G